MSREIKCIIATSVICLFLVVAPARASALSTKAQASSLEDKAQVLTQPFTISIPVTHSIAVWLNSDPLSLWNDGDDEDKDKKNNDRKDDRVPEPGVILQLALGLLGVAGLRLILKPQESNPR